MSISSLAHPRLERTGVAAATASVNRFLNSPADQNKIGAATAFFSDSVVSQLTQQPFAGKNENLCHTFSSFSGTWDYSEVD